VQVSSERFHVLYKVGVATPYVPSSPRNVFDPTGRLLQTAYEKNAIDVFEKLLRESCSGAERSGVARSLRDLLFADRAAAVEKVGWGVRAVIMFVSAFRLCASSLSYTLTHTFHL
jgi:hypothetical protein